MIQSAKDVHVSDKLFKVLVIGDYGSGKSIFASTFPTPGFIFDFDKGILSYRGKDFDYASYNIDAKGWMEFEKEFLEVKKAVAEGKYKTIIIDSTSTMSDLAMERALQIDPKRSATNGPQWNVHYGIVKNLVEGKLRQIMQLECNIVVIAHLQVVKDEETGAVISTQPLLPGSLSQKIPGYFDEVYYAFNRMKEGKPAFLLQTVSKGLYKARSRISGEKGILSGEIPNDYAELIKAIQKAGEEKK
jgi:hypothetical protein